MFFDASGNIKLSDEIILSPGYTFEQFKTTRLFEGQDGIRTIYLKDTYKIDKRNYLVSLSFISGVLYSVSFLCVDDNITMETERERKKAA